MAGAFLAGSSRRATNLPLPGSPYLALLSDGVLWQDDARTTPVVSDTDPVGSWDDSSGNNRHFFSPMFVDRPEVDFASIGSKPSIRFSGANYLIGPDLSGITSGTVYILVKRDSNDPIVEAETGLWTIGTSGQTTHYQWYGSTIYDDAGSDTRRGVSNATNIAASYNLYCVTSDSSNWNVYMNGTLIYNDSTNTVGYAATPHLGRSAGAFYLLGNVAAFLVYDSVHGDASSEMNAVEAYLSAKFTY